MTPNLHGTKKKKKTLHFSIWYGERMVFFISLKHSFSLLSVAMNVQCWPKKRNQERNAIIMIIEKYCSVQVSQSKKKTIQKMRYTECIQYLRYEIWLKSDYLSIFVVASPNKKRNTNNALRRVFFFCPMLRPISQLFFSFKALLKHCISLFSFVLIKSQSEFCQFSAKIVSLYVFST